MFDEFDERTLLEIGVVALKVTFEQLVPQLGMPVAVQRRIEYSLAPKIEWSIESYLDLETQSPGPDGELVSEIVDHKVKGGDAISRTKADRDPRASLCLAGRWLQGQPARAVRVRAGPPARSQAQEHQHLAHPDHTDRRAAALNARADRARRQSNQRPLRPART